MAVPNRIHPSTCPFHGVVSTTRHLGFHTPRRVISKAMHQAEPHRRFLDAGVHDFQRPVVQNNLHQKGQTSQVQQQQPTQYVDVHLLQMTGHS